MRVQGSFPPPRGSRRGQSMLGLALIAFFWLRDHFQPTRAIAYQYLVFDVSPQDLQRLCSQTSYCR